MISIILIHCERNPAEAVHAVIVDLHTRVPRINVNCRITNVIKGKMPDRNSVGFHLIMTPDNRAGQDLVKSDVTLAILFARVGNDRPIGKGSPSAGFLGTAMHPRCGNHGTFDPDSPCRPNLIARPRSTLLHIRLLPAFPRMII